MSAIVLDKVSRWYGNVVAVNDVTITIGPGITGLLGPNGAGKSTLISMMGGFLAPSAGTVALDGGHVWKNPEIYRQVGLVPEAEAMYDMVTGAQFLLANARLHGLGDPGAAARRALRAGGDVGDEAPGHAGREQRVAPGDHPDRLEQLGWFGVLDQEAASPGAEGLVDVFVGLEGSQDDDLDPGQVLVGRDAPGGFQAVDAGHPDVHQDDVGALAAGEVHGLLAIRGLTDDVQVLGRVDQDAEPGADQRLVVGEQDPDHGLAPSAGSRAPSAGRRAVT